MSIVKGHYHNIIIGHWWRLKNQECWKLRLRQEFGSSIRLSRGFWRRAQRHFYSINPSILNQVLQGKPFLGLPFSLLSDSGFFQGVLHIDHAPGNIWNQELVDKSSHENNPSRLWAPIPGQNHGHYKPVSGQIICRRSHIRDHTYAITHTRRMYPTPSHNGASGPSETRC